MKDATQEYAIRELGGETHGAGWELKDGPQEIGPPEKRIEPEIQMYHPAANATDSEDGDNESETDDNNLLTV